MPIKTYNIDEEFLKNYYINQKLSTGAIAEIIGCNHVTVLNYLKKYNIPRRSKLGNRKPISISKEELIKLYQNDNITQKEIAEKYGHSRYGIQRWMKIYGIQSKDYYQTHKVYPKTDFSGDLTEKAYLTGFRIGDLDVKQTHNLIQVGCSTTIPEQIELIDDLFNEYGNVHIAIAPRGTYEITTLLNNTFDFLIKKDDKIDKWILNDKILFLSFLAGYSDAEGSFYLRQPHRYGKTPWGMFEIQSYEVNILGVFSNKLTVLGIENKLVLSKKAGYLSKNGLRNKKDAWKLSISKKQSLWNFILLIEKYHRHEKRLRDLEKVKNNLIMRNSLPYCRKIDL